MCTATISACEKGRQWPRALGFFKDMQSQGLQANVITHTATISACGKGRQWQCALRLFKDMRPLGFQGSVMTYSATLSACGKSSGAPGCGLT